MCRMKRDLPMKLEKDARGPDGCGEPTILESSSNRVSASCRRAFKWFAGFTIVISKKFTRRETHNHTKRQQQQKIYE